MEELTLINKTKDILDGYGQASILYATAEFSPYSNQRKPDLQFICAEGKNIVFFIEYKINPKNIDSTFALSIIDHYQFVSEDVSFKVFYAFATNVEIDAKIKNFLLENKIVVFTEINTPEQLSSDILNWSKSSL